MNELRAEKQEKNQKKVKEENTTTTRACARLYGIDIDVARRLLMNTNLLIMDVVAASMRIKGMTKGEVKAWIEYMDEVDYCFTTGRQINRRNFRRSMRMFHEMNKAKALAVSHFHKAKHWTPIGCDYEEMERIKRNIEAKKLKDALAAPNAWELCDERCANFCADGCPKCKHWSIPPQLRERPIPPEQCPHFKAKGE